MDSSFLDFSPFCLKSVSQVVVVTILISKIQVIIRAIATLHFRLNQSREELTAALVRSAV